MLAIPALDLRDGHVVQLIGGDYAHESIRLERPRDVAREWSNHGFQRLHIVDLDAATARGSNRQVVRDLLGTPLLQSVFHADRWDYVFTFKRRGEEPQLRKVTVFFKNDALDRFEADTLPTEADFVASLDSGRKAVKVPVLEASEASLKQFPTAAKAPEPATVRVLPPLPATYPPLEPATP